MDIDYHSTDATPFGFGTFASRVTTVAGNAVAVALFILAHAVLWQVALVMTVGAMLGGYAGAYYAQKLEARTVGYLVIAIGCAMSAYFFWRMYLA